MINAIIFSMDRAMQLRLFLESVQKNSPGTFSLNVIYKHSSESFRLGYEKLKREFGDYCNFVEQGADFKKNVLDLLNSPSELSCFFTDDDIIMGQINEQDVAECLKDDDVFCFSPRLGKNVTYCYTLNCPNVLKPLSEDDKFICWDWTLHYADYSYPLSVDGHVFRTKEITKLTRLTTFNSPNTFEGGLQMFDNFPKNKMMAYKESRLVNTPNNIVNTTHPNRSGSSDEMTSRELNRKYLMGEVIDLDSMDFSNIIGCHQEIKFGFKKEEMIEK